MTAAPLALVAATPATAKALPVTCAGAGPVFSADAEGRLWRYALSGLDGITPGWSPKAQVGQGWSGFGRVLGGPGNRLYGINAGGVQRFRYTGSGWEPTRTITPSWTAYGTAAYRNKITVDEVGDFYLVDGNGRLLRSRYSEATQSFTTYNQVLATGWNRFDLIVAGAPGTLYAREPQGALFRFRYDPDSQRWLEQNRPVGTGWQKFTRGLTSTGGDILLGITATGAMHHFRFDASDGSWPAPGRQIGTGWSGPNVAAVTDTCHAVATPLPGRPSVGFTEAAPPAALQAGVDGALHFAYTADGTLVTGSAFPGEAVTWNREARDVIGTPTLVAAPDHTVQTFAHRADSDFDVRDRTGAWTGLAGRFVDTPAAVRAANGAVTAFGVAVDGSFWFRRPDAGGWLPWSRLSSPSLDGGLTVVPYGNDSVAVLARGTDEAVWAAQYRDGALVTPWASLGGSFTGTPAAVVMPGPALSVFARATSGELRHQRVTLGRSFPASWQIVGEADALLSDSSPAALLDEDSARILVFSRVDRTVYVHTETQSAAQTWKPGVPVPGVASTDPAAFTYRSGGSTSAFVVLDGNGNLAMYGATAAASAKGFVRLR